MTPNESFEKLLIEVEYRVKQSTTGVTFNLIKLTLAQCLDEMQYVLLEKNIDTIDNSSGDFERIVEQNMFGEDSSQTFTINAPTILRQLASEGWIVIPPVR
jgi:hypothetical protein